MPFKSHEEYLEYQRSYYRRRKRNSEGTQGLEGDDVFNPGLTAGLNKKILSPKSTVQSVPQQQGVTSALNPPVPKGLKPPIPPSPASPLNPVKPASIKATQEHLQKPPASTRPVSPTPVWSDNIWENTHKHEEALKRQGWESDGVGNAYRAIKE